MSGASTEYSVQTYEAGFTRTPVSTESSEERFVLQDSPWYSGVRTLTPLSVCLSLYSGVRTLTPLFVHSSLYSGVRTLTPLSASSSLYSGVRTLTPQSETVVMPRRRRRVVTPERPELTQIQPGVPGVPRGGGADNPPR